MLGLTDLFAEADDAVARLDIGQRLDGLILDDEVGEALVRAHLHLLPRRDHYLAHQVHRRSL